MARGVDRAGCVEGHREPTAGMPHRQVVVIHERLGYWAGQLRARLADRPIRWRESRSAADLLAAVAAAPPWPIVVLDLGRRPRDGLEALAGASVGSAGMLALVLDPESVPGLAPTAMECGASLVLPGFVPPPRVAELVDRWLPLARRRSDAAGLSTADEPDPDDPIALLGP